MSPATRTELNQLASQYPTSKSVSLAIDDLRTELELPKGTEHFVSDLHGEYDTFCHVLKNGSGAIRQAISDTFADQLTAAEQHQLLALICYPEAVLPLQAAVDAANGLAQTVQRLLLVGRGFAANYTPARVGQLLPAQFARSLHSLLYPLDDGAQQKEREQAILDNALAAGSSLALIITLAELIQKLAISHLHVIGDIFDRGPGAHLIMDRLMEYHRVDVQWGNHDILWMGAAAGSEACIATVIRIALRYADLETLQSGYGINLLPLAAMAVELYGNDPCQQFQPKVGPEQQLANYDIQLLAQMQKAIAVLQLKLEGQIIQRRPHYQMDDRLLLDKIDLAAGTVTIDKSVYPLLDRHLPTLSADNPYTLSVEENHLIEHLKQGFINSHRLQRHVQFLFDQGSMYRVSNGNLLYHGCVAMNGDGSFKSFNVDGEAFAGKAFVDRVDRLARQGYFSPVGSAEKAYGLDAMWYLWCGEQSPLFGKQKMATFERYFVADKALQAEGRNAYYVLRNESPAARSILQEFGVNPDSGRIINGHVPVKVKKGESPVKAEGKLLVIDGGYARAYRNETGIAGYTLVASAQALMLVAHPPFESVEAFIQQAQKGDLDCEVVATMSPPRRVIDSDAGAEIQRKITDLQQLADAYQRGLIREQ